MGKVLFGEVKYLNSNLGNDQNFQLYLQSLTKDCLEKLNNSIANEELYADECLHIDNQITLELSKDAPECTLYYFIFFLIFITVFKNQIII